MTIIIVIIAVNFAVAVDLSSASELCLRSLYGTEVFIHA